MIPSTWPGPTVPGVLLALLLAGPPGVAAQTSGLADDPSGDPGGWTADVGYAAANAVLSGVITGLFRTFSDDGSFLEGFRGGAVGGAVTYGGKVLSARRFDGAGLVGRQVASLGGSLASNAASGRGALDRLTFQLGLGRLYWDRVDARVSVRPDIVTLYYTALGVTSSRVELDWSRSLSAGSPVFVTRAGRTTLDDNAAGRAYGGVIVMDVNADIGLSDIGAHERVHVLQYDQQHALWGEAAERKFTSLFGPAVSGALGHVDLSIGLLPFVPFFDTVSYENNPFEREAAHLTGKLGS